ncbi:hypothetical protein [Geodermatophilus sp. TF02-6]|nr:hypothetical protein [Geodermatophilus sp. TF02-6]
MSATVLHTSMSLDGFIAGHVELERTRVLPGEAGVTHLHHRVRRTAAAA